jgi:hypothetical protein
VSQFILPSSATRTIVTPKKSVDCGIIGYWAPCYCASCGKEGPLTPEGALQEHDAYWVCPRCFKQYGESTVMAVMPDEVFYQKCVDHQMNKYGRLLTPLEMHEKLQDPDSQESLLARERALLTPKASF